MSSSRRPSFSIRTKVDVQEPKSHGPNAQLGSGVANQELGQVVDLVVTEDDVRICWKQFASTLPKEHSALAGRLQIIRPVLNADSSTITVTTDNRMVASDILSMRPQFEAYLRQQLQNSKLTINVVVEEAQTVHHIYSRVEQFQILEKRNPALKKLKEALDLDLS